MLRNSIIILSCILVFASSCITLKDSVVDEDKFLKPQPNSTEIYGSNSDSLFLNPFNINTDNWGLGIIERLMLIEFETLSNYRSVELQVIDNNGKKGALVILYYAGISKADIYYSPNLKVDKEVYEKTLNNSDVFATDIYYQFNEVNGLLKASMNFTDRFGNHINMLVDEQNVSMQPCGLLAPIGGEAQQPEFLTLVFMEHFRFLSQDEPNIKLSIYNKEASLLKLPVKVNGIKGYQTKYCINPVTVSLNKNTCEKLCPLRVEDSIYSGENFQIKLIENDGHFEIKSFTGIQQNHKVKLTFSPCIPDLQCLKYGVKVNGRFAITVDKTQGIIAGNYIVEQVEGKTLFSLKPTKGYSPVPGKVWMKKMTWGAEISNADSTYTIESVWNKK